MSIFFFLCFLIIFPIGLIWGLIRPQFFNKLFRGGATRRKTSTLFGSAMLVALVLFVATVPPSAKDEDIQSQIKALRSKHAQTAIDIPSATTSATTTTNQVTKSIQASDVAETPISLPAKRENTNPAPVVSPPTPVIAPISIASDRASMLATLKENAIAKWNDDFQMVKFEYDKQVEAYDWVMEQTKYPDIMAKAKKKWGEDFTMVEFEYNQQVSAYEWVLSQTKYPDIMTRAKKKWGTDYQMVKFEYNQQVKAFESL